MITPSTLEADFAQLAEAGELGTAGAGRRRRDVMNNPGRAGELRQAAEQGRVTSRPGSVIPMSAGGSNG